MSEKIAEELSIRPYARLLTMLGDQLIKNEIVALTELVKNSYDADGDFCKVAFLNFTDEYKNNYNSEIIISDNGFGMSYDIITKHFLNPATPVKKKNIELRHSRKGRVCQGEKGIGRFSMLKLGKKITVYSKEKDTAIVHMIVFDFEAFDNEFLMHANKEEDIYLDELEIKYEALSTADLPKDNTISQFGQGTVIKIQYLKGEWDKEKVDLLKSDLIKFSPLEIVEKKVKKNRDFEIQIYKNDIEDIYYEDAIEKLRAIINDKALYKISGNYVEESSKIVFSYTEANKAKRTLSISLKKQGDPSNDFENKLWGLIYYRNEIETIMKNQSSTICGDFKFEFYIFDFAANQTDDYGLNKVEKETVRNHRVFLYRDEVRVQPYGAANDDWLQIDRKRATVRANEMFSNDQLIGLIKITKKENENLKDKTSREGIIEDSKAFEQLTAIIRTFLSLVRTQLYQNYCYSVQKEKDVEEERKNEISNTSFKELESILKNNQSGLKHVEQIRNSLKTQKDVYEKRLNTAESLAGVGLSVEAASHDIMLTMERLKEKLREIKIDVNSPLTLPSRMDILVNNAETAEEMFSLVYMKMNDLQQLFVSSKQRPKIIRVEMIVKKIQGIYAKQYSKHNIAVEYNYIGKSPVVAKLIDAVLYQVFINLFDNSLYWLQMIDEKRKVLITFDGDNQSVIFSDNGYGIAESDAPYIFDAFYSGKGEDGRGLGLYIAKKLLKRNKYNIELLIRKDEKVSCGANFRLDFITEEPEEV